MESDSVASANTTPFTNYIFKAGDLFLIIQYANFFTSKLALYKTCFSFLLDVCLNELSEIQYNIIFKAEQQQAHGHCQVCHIIAVYIIGLEETSSLSVL